MLVHALKRDNFISYFNKSVIIICGVVIKVIISKNRERWPTRLGGRLACEVR